MPDKKINRMVLFGWAQVKDEEDTSGANNTWIYRRAPDGYLFELVGAQYSNVSENDLRYGLVAVYDGHEYTHWQQYPGVESRELIGRGELHNYTQLGYFDFHRWECKEFTVGIRSTSDAHAFKMCMILFYHLKKASRIELLEYALKHPIRQDTFKGAISGVTIEETET